VDNIEQADNVGVSQFLEEGYFADGSAGNTFVFGLEANLLEGDDAAAVGKVSRLVDDTVCAWLTELACQHFPSLQVPAIVCRCSRNAARSIAAVCLSLFSLARQWTIGHVVRLTLANLFQLLVILHGEEGIELLPLESASLATTL
jgi:hypothetical protein